jgi:hypothetical protein
MMTTKEYYSLIKSYVDGEISTDEFGMKFQKVFLAEQDFMGEPVFLLLNRLFFDWDAYYPECTPEQETPYMISEQTFRQAAVETKAALEQYLREKGLLEES